jgi:DNA-binding MurR/RpiR family transcriptional regulator
MSDASYAVEGRATELPSVQVPSAQPEPAQTVATRIRSVLDTMTGKERQVARVILAQYPAAGLESTVALSELAKVSGATVVRFASRLGYARYRDLQDDLRRELVAKNGSPLTRVLAYSESETHDAFTAEVQDAIKSAVDRTFRELPGTEVKRALGFLTDPDLHVHVIGGRYSRILADYLVYKLRPIRSDVYKYSDPADAAGQTVDMNRRDCLFIFDFRRYQPELIALARLAKRARARIVLMTDPWMSPIAEVADVVLPAYIDAGGPIDNYVAPLAVVEALSAAAHKLLAAAATDRLAAREKATDALRNGL